MTIPSTGPRGPYVGVAAMRPGATPPEQISRSGNARGSGHKRGWQEWVRASILPVVVAVAIGDR